MPAVPYNFEIHFFDITNPLEYPSFFIVPAAALPHTFPQLVNVRFVPHSKTENTNCSSTKTIVANTIENRAPTQSTAYRIFVISGSAPSVSSAHH